MQVFPVSVLWISLHELRLLPMDESTEGQAIPPGRREVGDIDSLVPMSLPLTPVQQAARMDLRLYREKQSVSTMHAASQEGAFSWSPLFPQGWKFFSDSADTMAR